MFCLAYIIYIEGANPILNFANRGRRQNFISSRMYKLSPWGNVLKEMDAEMQNRLQGIVFNTSLELSIRQNK